MLTVFLSPNVSPLKAVVIADFCCGTSDVLISYVYSSICICSKMSKFLSVYLNSKNELIFLWAIPPGKKREKKK